MASTRLKIDGYGQLELNNVAFRRDGRIEAQCALADTFAAVEEDGKVAENGMLLAVDKVTRTVKPATDGKLPIALNYSTEHMFDERKPGLKNFYLKRGTYLPRLGYLSVGDTFTTNCLSYDTDNWADAEALVTATTVEALGTNPIYAGAGTDGSILLSKTEPAFGPVLLVVEGTTMPDGQFGLKFHVLKA